MEGNKLDANAVQGLFDSVRKGKISRRKLIAALTSLGVTSAGAGIVAAARFQPVGGTQRHAEHLLLHDQHVDRQIRGEVDAMMADYADDAIVDDPLFDQPFVGKQAIAQRYAAEVASVPDRALHITNRVVNGDTLIVEWRATGTHVAEFLGFGGTGRSFMINGVTIVTRSSGKIIRESHYFNATDLRRQVEL